MNLLFMVQMFSKDCGAKMLLARNFCFVLLLLATNVMYAQVARAPAYPLVTHDPYFSIWSFGDTLNAAPTKHWTGKNHPLIGMIRVDGNTYNFLGSVNYSSATILPTGTQLSYECEYTFEKPADNWMQPAFKATGWTKGKGPFDDEAVKPATRWTSRDIWVRRVFTVNDPALDQLLLQLKNDDDVEVYLNGKKIYNCGPCVNSSLTEIVLHDSLAAVLRKGENVLALHCTNTGGRGVLDAGLARRKTVKNVTPAFQQSVNMTATSTRYRFLCGPVSVNLSFTSPLLLDSLDLLGRPVTYVDFDVLSVDGKTHDVQVYIGASSVIAANTADQKMKVDMYKLNSRQLLKAGTVEQPVL